MSDAASIKKAADFNELVMSIGRVFNNTFLYGSEHSVTRQNVDECYQVLTDMLEKHSELEFDIGDDELAVNNVHLELKNPLVRMFTRHLAKLNVHNFSLSNGISREKFVKFMEVLLSSPEDLEKTGGFTATLSSSGIDHVKAKQVRYQEIAEDEVVINKEELGKPGEGAGGDGSESIVAFLKGGIIEEKTSNALKERFQDPAQLAELIMQAAEFEDTDTDLSKAKPLSDVVAAALRRAYDGVSKTDAKDTKKGRTQLKKTLLVIEKTMIEQLEARGQLTEDSRLAVTDVVEEMVDELEIDTLATDYMKKRKAIEKNENRILRFIKNKGDDVEETELRDKLESSGLTEEQWRDLVARSGISGSEEFGDGTGAGEGTADLGVGVAGKASGAFGAIGHLAELLGNLESVLETSGEGDVSATDVVEEVHSTVENMAVQTGRKIKKLIKEASDDAEAEKNAEREGKPPPKPKLTKKRLLEILGEIGQELCQPLAVVTCSLQMISSKALGEVNDAQSGSLDLAYQSAEKLQELANKMISISGMPDTLSPDAEIQGSLYQEGG